MHAVVCLLEVVRGVEFEVELIALLEGHLGVTPFAT
jgi:hypothetical protein